MALRPIEPEQHVAAKVAGFIYLAAMAASIFAFSARDQLIVRGDVAQTARNIAASELIFRVSVVTDLLIFAADVILVVALYIVLRPINRNVALLAAFWRLVESAILAVAALSGFAILLLLGGADYLRAFAPPQVQALAQLLYGVYGAGFNIGFVFLGLGSTLFSYLWFKSRYIPRILAVWGVFSSLVLAVVTLAIMAFPALASVVTLVYMAPMGIYEIALGFWLLVKGIRAPIVA